MERCTDISGGLKERDRSAGGDYKEKEQWLATKTRSNRIIIGWNICTQ